MMFPKTTRNFFFLEHERDKQERSVVRDCNKRFKGKVKEFGLNSVGKEELVSS